MTDVESKQVNSKFSFGWIALFFVGLTVYFGGYGFYLHHKKVVAQKAVYTTMDKERKQFFPPDKIQKAVQPMVFIDLQFHVLVKDNQDNVVMYCRNYTTDCLLYSTGQHLADTMNALFQQMAASQRAQQQKAQQQTAPPVMKDLRPKK